MYPNNKANPNVSLDRYIDAKKMKGLFFYDMDGNRCVWEEGKQLIYC